MLWTWFCKYVDLYLTWNSFQSMKLYWEDFFRIVASLSCSAPPHVKNGLLSEWSISFLSPCPLLGPLGATNEHIQPPCISKGEKCCWIHCILWWQNSQRYQCSEYSCLFYYIFRYSDAEIIIDMLIYKISSIYIYIIYLLNRYLLNIYLFICFFVCFLALSPEQT